MVQIAELVLENDVRYFFHRIVAQIDEHCSRTAIATIIVVRPIVRESNNIVD